MASFLPTLTEYDPPDGEEGTLDPLGLALLATRIAEILVPGFTERLRRPRFMTMLALGSFVLSRREHYSDGAYGIEPDGPAYLGWERLVVESFAQKGKLGDDGLLGVPGIGKARDAKASSARLSSQLYLKNPAAVGVWVAYKGLAMDVGLLDKEGALGQAGEDLITAWAKGTGEPSPLTPSGRGRLNELDDALGAPLGRAGSKGNPSRVWDFLHRSLHPSTMTRPEAEVIEALLRDRDVERGRVFSFVERQVDAKPELELETLALMAAADDHELAWRARLAGKYEHLVGQLVTAFQSILFAAAQDRLGSVSVESTLGCSEVTEVLRLGPTRVRDSLAEFDAAVRGATEAAEHDIDAARSMREIGHVEHAAVGWLRNGALEGSDALFHALLKRHFETQRGKPPAGKRPWIEGDEGRYSVRLRFQTETPPRPDGVQRVHGYRTRAVASCFRDLRGARS